MFFFSGKPDSVRFSYSDIWMPDVFAFNDLGVYDPWRYKDLVLLSGDPNGQITWAFPAPMKTACKMDVTNFPFDSHLCNVNISSWQYDTTSEVLFKCRYDTINDQAYGGSMQWKITGELLQLQHEGNFCSQNVK